MRGYMLAVLMAVGLGGCVVVPAEYEYHDGPIYSYPYPRWGGSYYYYYDDGPRHGRHRHGRHRHRGWDRD